MCDTCTHVHNGCFAETAWPHSIIPSGGILVFSVAVIRNSDQKQDREERVYLVYRLQTITKGSQDRSLKQKPWKSTTCCPVPRLMLFYTAWKGTKTTGSGWTLLDQLIRAVLHRYAHRSGCCGQSLSWDTGLSLLALTGVVVITLMAQCSSWCGVLDMPGELGSLLTSWGRILSLCKNYLT